jgi:sugar lactone lactonase YvrE
MPKPALRRLAPFTTAACALVLFGASAAQAERVELIQGFASNLNGVTTGADGNVYLVEAGAQKVSVRAPDGSLVRQISLPGAPNTATSATLGPDGRVWVALSSADANRGFARIDTAGANTPLSTVGLLGCGPVGMARLSSVRMVFTAPSDGSCSVSDNIGGLNADGTLPQGQSTAGPAFDLAAAGGKAYVPDFTGDNVKRWTMGPQGYFQSVEASFSLPTGGSGPDGIEVGGDGRIYVTLYNSGQVARIEPNQDNGTSATIVASGLVDPFGIAAGSDGAVYVASQNARLLRITPDGSQRLIDLPAGFKAWQVAQRGDDIWVTDKDAPKAVVVRNAGRPEPTPITPGPAIVPAPALPAPPAPTLTPAAPKPLAAPKVFSLAAAKRCASRRSLTLTLRKRASGPKVTSVKVTIGSGKAKSYKGSKLKVPVTLTGLPKGSFKVKVAVAMSDGTTVKLTRSYKTCATKKKR